MAKKTINVDSGDRLTTKLSLSDFEKNVVKIANSGGFGIKNPIREVELNKDIDPEKLIL